LEWCEQFAPVKVARGNNDLFEHPQMADRHVFDVAGWRIGLVHEVRPESRPMVELLEDGLGGAAVDILITGDTHVQRLEFREQVLFMNPGSPTLPHHKEVRLGTVGLLEVSEDKVRAEIVVLGQTQGSPNPGRPAHLSVGKDARALREL
jgi:putative phosphoesterase